MKKYGKCQIVGCPQDAKWGQYKTVYLLKKIFLYVCDKCEKEIGDSNMLRSGGEDTAKESKK